MPSEKLWKLLEGKTVILINRQTQEAIHMKNWDLLKFQDDGTFKIVSLKNGNAVESQDSYIFRDPNDTLFLVEAE